MRRLRHLQIERQKTPTEIALDEFFELSDMVERKRTAYRDACELDVERNAEVRHLQRVLAKTRIEFLDGPLERFLHAALSDVS